MATVRKTVCLPPELAAAVEAEAERSGLSFSALVARRLAQRGDAYDWIGSVTDDPDLSLKVEEILSRTFAAAS